MQKSLHRSCWIHWMSCFNGLLPPQAMGGWPKSSKQNGEKGAQLLRCTVAGWGLVRAHKIDSVNALEEFISLRSFVSLSIC